MITPADILNSLPPHPTITMKKLREAVKLHQQEQDSDLLGFKLTVNPLLKGTQTLILTGEKAYYWPDILDTKNVKIIDLPEPKFEIQFWNE